MSINISNYSIRVAVFILDIVVINLAFGFIYFLLDNPKDLSCSIYRQYLVLFNIIWLAVTKLFQLYSIDTIRNLEHIYRATMRSLLAHIFLVVFYLTFTQDIRISREFLLFIYVTFCISFAITRFLLTILKQSIKEFKSARKVSVLGNSKAGKFLAGFFEEYKDRFAFQGYIDTHEARYSDSNGKLFPEIQNAIQYASQQRLQELYVPIPMGNILEARHLLREAEEQCVRLKFIPVISEKFGFPYLKIEYLGRVPVVSLRKEPLEEVDNQLRKRAFDIAFSLLVIIFILSWLLPVLAIIIKLTSKGPVFFKQERSGRDNKPFSCYKLRSMYVNEDAHLRQATRNDSRITPFGRFLRKNSLDELPQFFNVLVGNMSIVGPRPHMLKHTEEYRKLINQYMVRHFMKPGITGWAQINNCRGEITDPVQLRKRVELDIWYMENWSIMLDIRIIFLTIFNIFRGEKNAY
jgi:putative colanic acid biosysnthesis UDP-glucose lipid carrier transferase